MSKDMPPEPEWEGGSDAEFRKYKKAKADWYRMLRQTEKAAGHDPTNTEEENIQKAKEWSDRSFAEGVEEIMGYSLQDIREALYDPKEENFSIAEKAARDALQAADNAWFFKASKQRDAQKKIKKAKGDIKGRVSRRKSVCTLSAIVALAVASFEVYVIASGAIEVVQAITP